MDLNIKNFIIYDFKKLTNIVMTELKKKYYCDDNIKRLMM